MTDRHDFTAHEIDKIGSPFTAQLVIFVNGNSKQSMFHFANDELKRLKNFIETGTY